MHSVMNVDRGAKPAGEVAATDQRFVVDAMPAVDAVAAPQPDFYDILSGRCHAGPTGSNKLGPVVRMQETSWRLYRCLEQTHDIRYIAGCSIGRFLRAR